MKLVRLATLALVTSVLALTTSVVTVSAASTVVECGQVSAYTAPDPAGPTDGSLTIGLLTPWVIAADAALGPAVSANLPSVAGSGGPTCLVIDLDADAIITALEFAPHGDVAGAVVLNPGLGGYIFADRLLVPTFITDAYPGLAVIFVTSAEAGTNVSATFSVDVSSGQFTGVDAQAAFCGPGSVAKNGDGVVGEATIAASLLDASASAALAGAHGRNACAQVRTQGTIGSGTGEITTETDVTITVTAAPHVRITPPPTSTTGSSPERAAPTVPVEFLVSIGATVTLILLAAQSRRYRNS